MDLLPIELLEDIRKHYIENASPNSFFDSGSSSLHGASKGDVNDVLSWFNDIIADTISNL